MLYDDLVARLADGLDPVRVGAFPDGSVDDYYRLRGGESTVTSREAFAADITAGRDSFALDHVMTDAGGQAVNVARQAAALGDDVHLAGHLDHPIFDFDFETTSMGAPARVRVCLFEADDVMFVEESADLAAWSFSELERTLDSVDDFLERDALCCVNWASIPELGGALVDIASRALDGGVFCVDPGPLSTAGASDLLDALTHLDGYDVVVSVNDDEARRLATAAGAGTETDGADTTGTDALDGIRDATGATGVVVHGEDTAVASTPSGTVSVPTLDVSRALTETGAGDRFSAGLARSLAAGWGWDLAVAMGNACAAHYVAGNGTGRVTDLRTHVETHRP
jgi:sugar/nucleoside kinase (ribokinase family)